MAATISSKHLWQLVCAQPVDPLELWESEPFNVTVKDGYMYGRGVDDDKGGVLMAIQVGLWKS
jgi:acetylornithine deacetylase/succinyl-diaminopimelate desuccinylase-like protein